MRVGTLTFQEILKKAPDIYEAVVVAGRRAGQIHARRAAERVEFDVEDSEEDYPMMDDINEDYEEQEKATTLAMEDFMEDRLTWRYVDEDDAGPAAGDS